MPDHDLTPAASNFAAVAERLRAVLQRHVPPLVVAADGPAGFTLNVPRPDIPEPRRFFGGVRVGKRYVSYHLISVYMFPDLLEGMSPGLRARMQGKSCFNFTRVDEELIVELADLTDRSLERYRGMPVPYSFPSRG